MQQLPFDAFMLCSLQEVEHERLFHLELVKDEHVNLAVSRLPALITSSRSDEAITAVAPVVEAMVEVTSLANVEYLIMRDEKIDPSKIKRRYREAAERAKTKAMKFSASSILHLGIELERMT